MSRSTLKEVDLARHVIAYLRELKYEVHQEAGADIVALMNNRAWIIECKTTMGLAVMAQAWEWVRRGAAAFVSVATPAFQLDAARVVATWFMEQHGIGWITVGIVTGRGDAAVREQIEPRVQRHADRLHGFDIRRALNDKTLAGYAEAGSPAPRQWTPFKQVCENVRDVLKRQGPLTTRQLVDSIEHHYSSAAGARSRLSHYLAHGIIAGVESENGHRPTRWRLSVAARPPGGERA